MANSIQNDDNLRHAGVKGMRWGQRKPEEQGLGTYGGGHGGPLAGFYDRHAVAANTRNSSNYEYNMANDPKFARDERIKRGMATAQDYKSKHKDMLVSQLKKETLNVAKLYINKRFGTDLEVDGVLGGVQKGMKVYQFVSGRRKKAVKLPLSIGR